MTYDLRCTTYEPTIGRMQCASTANSFSCYTEAMSQPLLVQATKRLVIDTVMGVVGFPLWWYTRGLSQFARFVWRTLSDYQATLGIVVWVKNIFVPMYGSYDIPGRIISFFMRLAMIAFRGVALIVLLVVAVFVLVLYLALPVLMALMILYHAFGNPIFV